MRIALDEPMNKKCLVSRLRLGVILILAALPLLSGCATVNTPDDPSVPGIYWPSFPLEPRIQWTKEIRNRHDAGIGKSLWKRMVELVAGEEQDHIVKPYGIYVDAEERLFVADAGSSTVHVFDTRDKDYSVIGGGDRQLFLTPIALAGDDAGNVYITDSAAGTVFRYNTADAKVVPFLSGKLLRPTGIAFNRKNRLLYITDTSRHQVVVFDLNGRERFRIGQRGEGAGLFNFPTDLFIDPAGDLYVTDALNSRVQIFSAAGMAVGMFGSEGDSPGYFAKPKGVAVDSDGNIYVCDAIQDSLQIFDRAGRLLLNLGDTGAGAGQFWMPSGIFIDSRDSVYVADSYNGRIQIFKYLKLQEPKPAPVPQKK